MMDAPEAPADIAGEIFNLASLLGIVLAGPDADSAIDGMHTLAVHIRQRAAELREALKCA